MEKLFVTQIAPTPVLTGSSAKKILKQTKIRPLSKSYNGIEVLSKMFKNKER